MTPAEAPSAIAMFLGVTILLNIARAPPITVEKPAAITRPKANATSEPVSIPYITRFIRRLPTPTSNHGLKTNELRAIESGTKISDLIGKRLSGTKSFRSVDGACLRVVNGWVSKRR